MSLFTELTPSEQASLSGGKSDDTKRSKLKTLVIIGDIAGAGGGAGSGGAVGGKSGDATGGSGVVIVVK